MPEFIQVIIVLGDGVIFQKRGLFCWPFPKRHFNKKIMTIGDNEMISDDENMTEMSGGSNQQRFFQAISFDDD
jgi:hypothetical protein